MKKNFSSLVFAFSFTLTAGICLTACGENNSATTSTDSYQILDEVWESQLKAENFTNLTATMQTVMTPKAQASGQMPTEMVETMAAIFDNGKQKTNYIESDGDEHPSYYAWENGSYIVYDRSYVSETEFEWHKTVYTKEYLDAVKELEGYEYLKENETFAKVVATTMKTVTDLVYLFPNFKYNNTTHSYKATLPVALDLENQSVVLDFGDHPDEQVSKGNFELKFENNNLVSAELTLTKDMVIEVEEGVTVPMTMALTSAISNIGTSTVTLPSVEPNNVHTPEVPNN